MDKKRGEVLFQRSNEFQLGPRETRKDQRGKSLELCMYNKRTINCKNT